MPIAIPYRSLQRVYFDDLDALNILHNMRYLLFMERARGELFQTLGFRWEDDLAVNPDKFHVVAAHQIDYLHPFRGEGEIVVELRPTHLGATSFRIAAELKGRHGSQAYARGESRLVRLDPTSSRPCPWSPRFRAAMEPLVVAPEGGGGAERDVSA